jgi:hypothetical protein
MESTNTLSQRFDVGQDVSTNNHHLVRKGTLRANCNVRFVIFASAPIAPLATDDAACCERTGADLFSGDLTRVQNFLECGRCEKVARRG